MQDFRELKVRQKAHQLTLAVYRAAFPRHEQYGLTSQVRRACTSIPANLAEGGCRKRDRDFAHFVHIALGSASEAEYLLLLAGELGYVSSQAYDGLLAALVEVKRMLSGLLARLKASRDDHGDVMG